MLVWLFAIGAVLVLVMGFSAFTGAPYVPSRKRDVEQAFLELYPLSSQEMLYDLGSGDGKVLRIASKYGARAVGVEIIPLLVWVSRLLSRFDKNIEVRLGDYRRQTLPSQATIVYVFGEHRDISRMLAWVQAQVNKRNTPVYVLSYAFELPGCSPVRRNKSHFLYQITPDATLQHEKAQV